MHYLYKRNFKSYLRDTKLDLNKWKDIPSRVRLFNYKDVSFPLINL